MQSGYYFIIFFFSSNLYNKTEQKTEKTTFLLHMYYIIVATAVCTAELFVLQETFLSFKIRALAGKNGQNLVHYQKPVCPGLLSLFSLLRVEKSGGFSVLQPS